MRTLQGNRRLQPGRQPDPFTVVALCLVAVLSVTVLLLSGRLGEVSRRLAARELAVAYPFTGMQLPPISARARGGGLVGIAQSLRAPQLLLYAAAGCRECEQSVAGWRSLLASVADKELAADRVMVLAADTSASTLTWAETSLPAITAVSALTLRERRALRLRLAPATLVVDTGGVVVAVHLGRFAGDSLVSRFREAWQAGGGPH